ncbi:MAG TPA: class I SAM-dependent methyltransferase [Verrucomicrobiae bacterium]|nr:class I SAM-dependent methyltransferase [Verrucomicrobiae bacterium]
MNTVWNADTYDSERRRLVPCFDEFYGTVAELIFRFCPKVPRVLDLGAGTGLLSSAILERVQGVDLTVLDASSEMLNKAQHRLARSKPKILVRELTDDLPSGPFDGIVSALAIHHLADEEKRALYARVLEVLSPGGVFINAEQVSGSSPRLQQLFEATHLDRARQLGSSEAEVRGAIERMRIDRCATVADQLNWLTQAGFADVDCFFRWFRFAVFGGWKRENEFQVASSRLQVEQH